MTADDAWLDEIELDPQRSFLTMGTRALGERPWLVADAHRDPELAIKARLCTERHAEVFAALEDTWTAGESVEELVRRALVEPARAPEPTPVTTVTPLDTEPARRDAGDTTAAAGGAVLHPLDRTGRSIQEDLCLLRRRNDGWYLEAASLCCPSRWRLADKIGRHITEVHGPVDGYTEHLASRIDSLFDRLTDRPVWRRNWYIHPDATLFQPAPPVGGDPIIEAASALETLVVRSERQTLRRLPDDDRGGRWVLFTIRVQQAPLGRFCIDEARRDALDGYLAGADPGSLAHRGMAPAQVREIRTALAHPAST